jgi:hypothetical protein
MQLALKCRIKGGNNSPARERVSPTTVAVARVGRVNGIRSLWARDAS